MPIISVIIPVYKVEKYLKQCVDSVINQTIKDIEIILVDDGSPDGCPALIDMYASKDKRIKAIHQENKGLGGARNTGLEVAQGDYIAFVDSDDWIAPEFCEKLYKRAIETEADLILTGETLYMEESGKFAGGWRDFSNKKEIEVLDDKNFVKYFTPAWARLYKREYLNKYKLKFVEKCFYEDNSWGCFFIMNAASVAFAGNLYFYRQRSESITAKKDAKVLDFIRDCEYFLNFIKKKGITSERVKLCKLWYLLNFYNYFFNLEKGIQDQFFDSAQKLTKDWDITLEDISLITKDKELQIKIFCWLKNLDPKKMLREYSKSQATIFSVNIFGLFEILRVVQFSYKTTFLLFKCIPLLKVVKTENKTKYLLFKFIPILKIYRKF